MATPSKSKYQAKEEEVIPDTETPLYSDLFTSTWKATHERFVVIIGEMTIHSSNTFR
jgi:hypothetical protein